MSTFEKDINTCLTHIKKEAIKARDTSYNKMSLKNVLSKRLTAADAVLPLVEEIRSIYALIMHHYRNGEADNVYIPNVPSQQPAPIRVGISNNNIHLTTSQTRSGALSAISIERLRKATQELLDRTIEQIGSSSNIDPRLAPNLIGLNSYLATSMEEMPIEALGLNYQFASRGFGATRETIPDAISEQIEQILTTVNVIINQYEEWRLYTSAETALSLPSDALKEAVESSKEVASYLEQNDGFVERKLIDRLKEITDAYFLGLVNLESAAVPLIESLGNIFSELSRYVINHSPAAGNALSEPGAMLLFLGFTIRMIEVFTPTLSRFPPLSYLIDVQKFAQKQFSLIKDSISIRP